MFRKTLIALAATATVGAAALTPTTASAWTPGWHGWHHHHHGPHFRVGFIGPRYVYDGCYRVKRVVATPYGPRVRYVTVCD